MKTNRNMFLLLLTILVVGCSHIPELTGESLATATQTSQTPALEKATELINPRLPTEGVPTTMYQSLATPFSDAMQTLIDQIKADLAERLSIATDQVKLVGVQAVTWPDSSLGCPQEGMMYAQVLTPGYLIQMEYRDIQYEYHSGKNMQQAVYCENPGQALPGNPDS